MFSAFLSGTSLEANRMGKVGLISLTTLPEKNWQGSFYVALLTQGFLLVVVLLSLGNYSGVRHLQHAARHGFQAFSSLGRHGPVAHKYV
jgi:hypothetical protein